MKNFIEGNEKYLGKFRELLIPTLFGSGEDVSEDANEDYLNEIVDQIYNLGGECARGASKLCVIPPEGEAVIKLPFLGEVSYDYGDDRYVLTEFIGAKVNNHKSWNYCEAELELYEKAAAAGFGCFLAKTAFYGTTYDCDHPMYVQEKVLKYDLHSKDDDYIPSEDSAVIGKRISKVYREYFRTRWGEDLETDDEYIGWAFERTGDHFMSLLIDAYGYNKTAAFGQWMYKNAKEMASDLHWGNIGFRESDNTPCLLDFSGFYS